MKMQVSLRLIKVLGSQVFWSYALVTFLMACLLSFVNMASRYALKDYVDSQLDRTPWDFTVFKSGGSETQDLAVIESIRTVEGVEDVESLAILRAKLTPEISEILVDSEQLQTPWITLVAASNVGLLPPQLQMTNEEQRSREIRPILALVGPENAMGEAFRALQGAREFSIEVKNASAQRSVFSTALEGVVRLDREELSRWLMDQMGAPAYIPPIGAVLLMPYDQDRDAEALREFDMLARGIVPMDMMQTQEEMQSGMMQHEQKGEYVPEVIYLAKLNRDELISGWDVDESLNNLVNISADVLKSLANVTQANNSEDKNLEVVENEYIGPNFWLPHLQAGAPPQVKNLYEGELVQQSAEPEFVDVHGPNEPVEHHDAEMAAGANGYVVDSTTKVLLQQMQEMAKVIGIVTLLISIPLLWMSWMFASNLSGLLMLNERRRLGLMRLRGIPGAQLGKTLLGAISIGGFLGGLSGIILGSVILLYFYEGSNFSLDILLQPQQIIMSLIFLGITLFLTLLVSYKLVKYAITISPLEASGRFASSEKTITSVKFGFIQFIC
ncbi:MAG: hypothetical protein HKN08_08295, partial [Gammaproteobacteria bacterium]|nr:hypothetical protein [Gammaproteobacteria bacterium]